MRDLKKQTSLWIRDQLQVAGFAWQEGYAAITVSPSGLDQVVHYIATQAEHHHKQNSSDELLELLQKVGIDFDPGYFE
jgi:putative transposase